MNKIFKNLLIIFILLGFTYFLNYKLNLYTYFNKYSDILENKIYKLHTNLVNKNNIIDKNFYNDRFFNNIYNNNFNNINNTLIILIITIYTSIIFFYIFLFNKTLLTSPFIILYIIFILITLKILF